MGDMLRDVMTKLGWHKARQRGYHPTKPMLREHCYEKHGSTDWHRFG